VDDVKEKDPKRTDFSGRTVSRYSRAEGGHDIEQVVE